ncbi:VOC family protein [Streptomyces pluripotens]|uniref:VOC family protein n=1 Tax=Streptomyces pluripotens TaxID=1355015 RepID=A0A221P4E6_9ACTN|nr:MULTISPECIES: VOC family protein [Streptomyces]ARP72878.1 glyxoylase [Streptomyces pluripotens]ASN27129.1 VOC family protein [Streptomyces pluripotens]KIE23573.1 glyxoylase [Streptomyces sp. MUSC 125]MCH0559873.1 VOC family protein [Streptomyces sp. MUM 16J]
MVKPIPDGYAELTVYLSVAGADEAIAFYAQAFGAKELQRYTAPDGTVPHAQIRIGDTIVMLSDEAPAAGLPGPEVLGGTPVTLYLFVADVDAAFAQAVRAGAQEKRPVRNQFFGERTGQVIDPFGHRWTLASRIENVSSEEFERRANAYVQGES